MKHVYLLLFLIIFIPRGSTAQEIIKLTQKDGISFRGIATYKNHAVWVSGNKGTVGKSLDGGTTWSWVSPTGYEDFDFRDIQVFNDKEALLLSAGSPAIILRTANGGQSWTEVYRDERPDIFLDGMDFKGKEGFVLGDPIDGLFQQLQTRDKGKTWKDVSNFMFFFADEGEAAFAASGSSVLYLNNNVWLGTGGTTASIFRRNEKTLHMDKFHCPILQGKPSQGVFSIDFINDKTGIAVGGDYMDDQNKSNVVLLTYDGGENWVAPSTSTAGFRSAVKYITADLLIATGTSGTDISTDAGKNWNTISTASYNSIAPSKSGHHVYLTGSNGDIAKITFKK